MASVLWHLSDSQRQFVEENGEKRQGGFALSCAALQDLAIACQQDQTFCIEIWMTGLDPGEQGSLKFFRMEIEIPEKAVERGLPGYPRQAEPLNERRSVGMEPIGKSQDVLRPTDQTSEEQRPEGFPWIRDSSRVTPVRNLSQKR